MSPSQLPSANGRALSTASRMAQILDSSHPLCKDDILWALNMVKQKLAQPDEHVDALEPERLRRNFRYFAEISTLMLKRNGKYGQESERLRYYLSEAAYGLWNTTSSSNEDTHS
ncbi:methyltransferase [Paenibacillus sp. SC116]|uniref:methyltransferase n=1 Tax=Paenibacillus sp. SC116 TaxID=2968986 RepID=UPI00215B1271|nr:methyltransferase [Paenibacillus sp. SC116]MCR8845681.1 methyltransferase [Paenibacillus sp. SC116]